MIALEATGRALGFLFYLYQNLTQEETDAVAEAYAPLDENGDDKAKIAISNMRGDTGFVCTVQQAARVSFLI